MSDEEEKVHVHAGSYDGKGVHVEGTAAKGEGDGVVIEHSGKGAH